MKYVNGERIIVAKINCPFFSNLDKKTGMFSDWAFLGEQGEITSTLVNWYFLAIIDIPGENLGTF